MKKRMLLWSFALFWLLGPVEPVFAYDGDVAGQFPDVVSGAGNGWSGGVDMNAGPRNFRRPNRHRSLDFGADQGAPSAVWTSSQTLVPRTFRYTDAQDAWVPNACNFVQRANSQFYPASQPAALQPATPEQAASMDAASMQAAPEQASSDFQRGQMSAASARSGANLQKLVSQLQEYGRKPDKISQQPEVDADGVRHFANGRHHDLSQTSVDQAISDLETSDLDIAEQRHQAIMQRRQQATRRFQQFNGWGTFIRF